MMIKCIKCGIRFEQGDSIKRKCKPNCGNEHVYKRDDVTRFWDFKARLKMKFQDPVHQAIQLINTEYFNYKGKKILLLEYYEDRT